MVDIVAAVRSRTQTILDGLVAEGSVPPDSDLTRISVRPSVGVGRGDLVINAGPLRAGPGPTRDRAVASRLAEALAAAPEVDATEVAGSGFVNVTLSLHGLTASLAAALAAGGDFGRGVRASAFAVGLAAPRRAGPLDLGRARAAVVTDALARILAFAGHAVGLPPDPGDPAAPTDLARIGVAPWFGADLPDDGPGDRRAILVHEAEQGAPPRMPADAAAELVAVAPCRLWMSGTPVARRATSLAAVLDLADGAALRCALLARTPGQALDLDPGRAADASHAGLAFNLRFAHARARGVLRRAAAAMPGVDLAPAALARSSLPCLSHPGERALLRLIALYPDRIAAAAALRDPSRVVVFLAELADALHGQWKASKDQPQLRFVNEEQRDLTKARLGLVTAAALVLHSGLGVLGVSAPDEMR